MKNIAAFLDRDGVINKFVPDLSKKEQIRILDFSAEAIRLLNELKFVVIIVVNSPQVAKGYCTEEMIKEINNKVVSELKEKGAIIDAVYSCPHHPERGFPGENIKYKIKCNCRKPNIGMLEEAAADFNIDLSRSFIVGDTTLDIKAGENVRKKYPGFKTILVKTGLSGLDGKYFTTPDFVVENILEAAKLIKSLVNE